MPGNVDFSENEMGNQEIFELEKQFKEPQAGD